MLPWSMFIIVALVVFLGDSSLSQSKEEDEIKGPVTPWCNGSLCTTMDLITEHNHKGESHSVITDDGYVLTVFRVVPPKNPAPVVILQHGFLCSSDCWVLDPNALAFKLSDAGFDVWINNVRGTVYSRYHTKLKPEDKKFWNFSWHEMGTKDLPAVMDYVMKTTGQNKLHFVGYSMGTTISYVLASTLPQYNQHFKSMVSLAPVAFLSKMTELVGPDGFAEKLAAKYIDMFRASDKVELFPREDVNNNSKMQITCNDLGEVFRPICLGKIEESKQMLGGAYIPAGQSFKTLDHFYQMSVFGSMRYYNMSMEENKEAYGSEELPVYTEKFSQISAPVLLWSADYDYLIQPKDVDDLIPLLSNVVVENRIKEECFGHLTFVLPRTKSCLAVRDRLYSEIVQAIKQLD